MVTAEQMSGAVLRYVVAENFIWDSKPCKYFLHLVDHTSGCRLPKPRYFKLKVKLKVGNYCSQLLAGFC